MKIFYNMLLSDLEGAPIKNPNKVKKNQEPYKVCYDHSTLICQPGQLGAGRSYGRLFTTAEFPCVPWEQVPIADNSRSLVCV